jgi:hypothetical protein
MKLNLIYITVVIIIIFVSSSLLISQDYMYWADEFSPIALQNIQTRDQVREASSSTTLYTSGDAEISADNSTTAQLSFATDTLFTEYKLTFDGDGSSATGGTGTTYVSYDNFLTMPAVITYVSDDNDVDVTLHVRAGNYTGQLASAGIYTATQTLTVHWVGP